MKLWPFGRKSAESQPAGTRCSFCRRSKFVVGPMVEGPDAVFICVDCVHLAARVADANAGKLLPATLDPREWRSAHMNLVCYVRAEQDADGTWIATAAPPPEVEERGTTLSEAICRLQAKVLASAATSLSEGKDVGKYFVNHADPALR